ncbi:MAG: PCRF domain-containing protein, partial [Christensenellaceae bacterium]|nr:PCRF domain-containing protein [Christensenellaceae bacterium]
MGVTQNNDSVVIEIRPAAGGDEASLFVGVLMKMYSGFAAKKGFNLEIADIDENSYGGIKRLTMTVEGKDAYSFFRYESGVHRIQRVPKTEKQGRIHTSTATVAVLPEIKEVDFKIDEKDLRIDVYRASGAGGQHINKTESAVRITHLPTNLVVACQERRSQIQNKARAMAILRSKLFDFYQNRRDKEYAEKRHNQVGSGERNERIRTYNFPQ